LSNQLTDEPASQHGNPLAEFDPRLPHTVQSHEAHLRHSGRFKWDAGRHSEGIL
jgi:hypothetical protein